jgi:mycofactocin precursor
MTSIVTESVVSSATVDPTAVPIDGDAAEDVVLAELLIEEISIDGMCGVY